MRKFLKKSSHRLQSEATVNIGSRLSCDMLEEENNKVLKNFTQMNLSNSKKLLKSKLSGILYSKKYRAVWNVCQHCTCNSSVKKKIFKPQIGEHILSSSSDNSKQNLLILYSCLFLFVRGNVFSNLFLLFAPQMMVVEYSFAFP